MTDLSSFDIRVKASPDPLIVGKQAGDKGEKNKLTVSISPQMGQDRQKIVRLWLGASVGSADRDLVGKDHVSGIEKSVAGPDGLLEPTATQDTLDVRKGEQLAGSSPWTLILEKSPKGFWLEEKQTLEITLSNLLVVGEGSAVLTVYIQDRSGVKELEVVKKVPAKKPGEPACEILEFDVTPRYIASGAVKVTWKVAGAKEVDVTKSGVAGSLLQSAQRTELRKEGTLSDTPTVERTTYALTATPPETTDPKLTREVTVYKTEDGWGVPVDYSATLGEPSTLFADQKTMYAIFLRGGKAALYRSADGLNAWFQVTDHVPENMETSPGVALDNKLWLVGGSATSRREAFSSAVWYYDTTETNTAKRWQEVPRKAKWPTPRFGHACVVFKPAGSDGHSIWLLGGYDENHAPLNDVWRFDPNAKTWERVLDNRDGKDDWERRLMLGAAVDEGSLYIFGGVVGPFGKGVSNSYRSKDGETWHEEGKAKIAGKDFPLAAALVGGATSLYRFATHQDDTRHAERHNRELGTYSQISSGPGRWETYEQNPFSLAGVYFKERFFLRTLADPSLKIGAEKQKRALHYLKPH